jgi:hypothetical protein
MVRLLTKASHVINMKNKIAKKEIIDPIEDKVFHEVYLSG